MLTSVSIYDNGGKTADRYTAIDMRRHERAPGTYAAIGFDVEPFHPLGIGQHTTAMPGRHLGKRVRLIDLPTHARQFVEQFEQES